MIRQLLKITSMNLKSIGSRPGASSIIVIGIAGVVAVLVALLSMSEGFRQALGNSSQPGRAIVLRAGAQDEITSWMVMDDVRRIAQLEGVQSASPELFAVMDVPGSETGRPTPAIARGVSDVAFAMRPELDIVAGRKMEPGRNELLVGVEARRNYRQLELGDTLDLRGGRFTVVGHFRSGTAIDGEIWLDLPVAQAMFRRGNTVSTARLRLHDPALLEDINTTVDEDPRLQAHLVSENTFYTELSRGRSQLIEAFAYIVAGIMALGAVVAASNVMFSAVSARAKEIATLRAIGFGPLPVLVSLIVETLLLALVGGLAGGLLIFLALDGYQTSTMDSASMSQVAFSFAVTPDLVVTGVVWALVLGVLGGLVPAVSAARLPVTEGLKG